ncbi:MAG: LysM peptidoglycan-binding protein [Gemmatimonadetes bacterium]|nr:LysM peptidoglycan-binding protein [Gemmatimonadota bacterium]
MKTSLLVAAGLLAAAPLAAQQTPAAGAQDRVHTVQNGETLWGIAQSYMSDPFLWPEIFRLNTGSVRDPARIYPGQRLALPEGVSGPAGPGDDRTVFYPSASQEARNRILGADGPPIPAVTPADFYRAAFLAQASEVRTIGRVAGPISPTVVPIEHAPQIQPYDRINVALTDPSALRVGDRVGFLAEGGKVEPLGRVYRPTGIGTVAAVQGSTATLQVVQMFGAVSVGDLVTPSPRFPVPVGVVPGASAGPDVHIVAFAEEHTLHNVEELAFLDAGRAEGIHEGDEFETYLSSNQAEWGVEPAVTVGRLQVVKVTEHTATVRVRSLRQPALRPGLPARRIGRMP